MVKVYLSLIKKGLRTIEEVPEKYKEAVKILLESEKE